MRKLLCKIWQFLLNIFTDIVNAVAQALATIGTAVVDILSQAAGVVGDALGITGSTIMWLAIGLGAYFLLSKDDNSKLPDKREVPIG